MANKSSAEMGAIAVAANGAGLADANAFITQGAYQIGVVVGDETFDRQYRRILIDALAAAYDPELTADADDDALINRALFQQGVSMATLNSHRQSWRIYDGCGNRIASAAEAPLLCHHQSGIHQSAIAGSDLAILPPSILITGEVNFWRLHARRALMSLMPVRSSTLRLEQAIWQRRISRLEMTVK